MDESKKQKNVEKAQNSAVMKSKMTHKAFMQNSKKLEVKKRQKKDLVAGQSLALLQGAWQLLA